MADTSEDLPWLQLPPKPIDSRELFSDAKHWQAEQLSRQESLAETVTPAFVPQFSVRDLFAARMHWGHKVPPLLL